jgi:RNA polymerase-binding protein
MMADRVMRGSRLGAVSYETDRNHNLAPRQIARYRTENGHAAAAASLATGRGHEPRAVPGPRTESSDLMTQKICFDCFHKLFPDKPIRKVTLGRQCVVCKAQTDRTEQMIPVEAEDIPLVKQIAS